MEMTVSLKENSYPIYIEKGILNQADKYIKEIYQGNKIMIISDDQVYHYYGDLLTNVLNNLPLRALSLRRLYLWKRSQI